MGDILRRAPELAAKGVPANSAGAGTAEVGWADRICIALLVIATAARICYWLIDRSLWLDETYLAVNLTERGLGELHRSLEYSQSAPYLFLIVTKAVTLVLGPGELALRLVSLVVSVVSLVLFWRLARKLLPGWVVPVALAIFSFAYWPLYFAQEAKQYSFDIFCTVGVTCLGARTFDQRSDPQRRFAWFATVGAVGVFATHAMPFVLAGLGMAMLGAVRERYLRLPSLRVLAAIAAWVVLAAVNYVVFIDPSYADPVMKQYWAFAYPGLPWKPGNLVTWFALISGYVQYLGYEHVFKVLVIGLMVAGGCVAVRGRRWVLIAMTITLGAYWCAGVVGKAPFFGRLVIFLFPSVVLLAAAGLAWSMTARGWVARALVAGTLLVPSGLALPRFIQEAQREDLREAVIELAQQRRPDDAVFVMYWAQPALRYYRRTLGLTNLAGPGICFGTDDRIYPQPRYPGYPSLVVTNFDRAAAEAQACRGDRPLWVLVAHQPNRGAAIRDHLLAVLDGNPEAEFEWAGCQLYRFGMPAGGP